MFLIFDTETTGLPRNWNAPLTDADNWPRCVQIAWQLHGKDGNCISHENYLIRPDGFSIPYDAEKIHGISTVLAEADGFPLAEVLEKFEEALRQCEFIGGHNVKFDLNILGAEFLRLNAQNPLVMLDDDVALDHLRSSKRIQSTSPRASKLRKPSQIPNRPQN